MKYRMGTKLGIELAKYDPHHNTSYSDFLLLNIKKRCLNMPVKKSTNI